VRANGFIATTSVTHPPHHGRDQGGDHRQDGGEAEVSNMDRKVKKHIHNTLSPASGDKSVDKIVRPSKYRTFLPYQMVVA
jgi:hypothetical protein